MLMTLTPIVMFRREEVFSILDGLLVGIFLAGKVDGRLVLF